MIYCVEDDKSIRDIELYALRSSGFEAEGYADAKSFLEALKEEIPELVILDVMLPGVDGVEILRRMRQKESTALVPVIMATAKGAEFDKIQALDIGADDYLVKPFGMLEMVSRVRAVLRRTMASGSGETELVNRGLKLKTDEHVAICDGKKLSLTLKEYELLKTLMSHPGLVYTRDQLLGNIWGLDYDGETRTVDVHIRTLRQKLGDNASCIETVRGVGYRMLPPGEETSSG